LGRDGKLKSEGGMLSKICFSNNVLQSYGIVILFGEQILILILILILIFFFFFFFFFFLILSFIEKFG
jgi:hypothetical protein